MKRPIYLLLALMMVGMLLTACAQQATPTTPTPSAPAPSAPAELTPGTPPTDITGTGEQPQYGGTLRSIHQLMLANLGYVPDQSEPLDGWIAQTAVETLLRFNPDGSLAPFLATDWTVSPDMKTVIFHLRKGVKFHDGTDFNAEAVKYNIDLYNQGLKDDFRSIESMDVIDDYTLQVNFSQVQVGELLPFAGRPGQIQSPTALKEHPKEWFLTHVVGTGPFKEDSYTRDISLKFTKFDDYWQKGKPYLDAIEFMFIADMTTATMALKAGEGDTLTYPSQKDLADLQAAGFNIRPTGGPIFTILIDGGNPNSPYYDIRVRQAIAHAIDLKGICDALGFGWWEPENQWSWPTHWSYDKAVKGYNYDPAKAKQLLSDAGYPNGFKTTIFGGKDYPELVQKYLSDVGIEATLDPGTMANVAERRQKGWNNGITITPVGGVPLYQDSKIGLALFSSTSGSYPNIFHNQEIDDLIDQANTELDFAKRHALNDKLNEVLVDKYCANIPGWHNVGVRAESPKVKNWDFIISDRGTWAPEDAWLAK
jgi:peptide/nickel transport system substrate-binding protein